MEADQPRVVACYWGGSERKYEGGGGGSRLLPESCRLCLDLCKLLKCVPSTSPFSSWLSHHAQCKRKPVYVCGHALNNKKKPICEDDVFLLSTSSPLSLCVECQCDLFGRQWQKSQKCFGFSDWNGCCCTFFLQTLSAQCCIWALNLNFNISSFQSNR